MCCQMIREPKKVGSRWNITIRSILDFSMDSKFHQKKLDTVTKRLKYHQFFQTKNDIKHFDKLTDITTNNKLLTLSIHLSTTIEHTTENLYA